ncbi:hypothetical protein FB446DRAFT_708142 [Lentinula raphanica]|nr:hypothetical protein FB446DRAFT_708142 [Lentinula raphanica]
MEQIYDLSWKVKRVLGLVESQLVDWPWRDDEGYGQSWALTRYTFSRLKRVSKKVIATTTTLLFHTILLFAGHSTLLTMPSSQPLRQARRPTVIHGATTPTEASRPIPQHVGFVMDGNRRYARGDEVLHKVLEICFATLRVCRPEQEVEALMQVAESKLLELCPHGDLLQEYDVKLNVIGRTSLFPESVQAVRRGEDLTKENNRVKLGLEPVIEVNPAAQRYSNFLVPPEYDLERKLQKFEGKKDPRTTRSNRSAMRFQAKSSTPPAPEVSSFSENPFQKPGGLPD